eukprot:2705953-Rhodomonas_salina.3
MTGVLKPGDRRERFAEAPPPLGIRNSTKQWWERKSSNISAVTDWELGQYLIGHSFKVNFQQEYWQENPGITFSGKALDVCKDDTFPAQLCLCVLLTVRKGKPTRCMPKVQ